MEGGGPGESSSGGVPAPYGRACTNCVKAKCRCILRIDGADCERCHRLSKECVPSVTVRKRNGRRSQVSRAAALEDKLEDIVTLLRNQNTTMMSPGPGPGPGAPAGDSNTARSRSSQELSIEFRPSTPSSSGHSVSTHLDGSGTRAHSPSSIVALPPARTRCKSNVQSLLVPGTLLGSVFRRASSSPPAELEPDQDLLTSSLYMPTAREAEENFESFRTYMLPFLPFMHMPPTMTVHHLQHHYPFLWFNVMTATCLNVDQQRGMAAAATKYLAQKVVVESEKSLDLLLGVLTSITWAYNNDPEKKRLPVMYMLAKSLAYDLGLNKATVEQLEPCYAIPNAPPANPPLKENPIEERRAALACFCITSYMSSKLKRREALNWNSFMDESLKMISTRPEWDGDIILASQVKIQLLVQELARASEQSGNRPSPALLASLRKRLHSIRTDLPRHLQDHEAIISYLHYTDLVFQETALTTRKSPPPFTPDYERYEMLQSCLTTVTAWFETYCRMPTESYLSVPFTFWAQMALCSRTLYRLTVLDDPAWDRQAVRDRLDFIGLCDRLVESYERATEKLRLKLGVSIQEDQFTRAARVLRLMKASAEVEIQALERGESTASVSGVGVSVPVTCSATVGMIPADDHSVTMARGGEPGLLGGVYGAMGVANVHEPYASTLFQPSHHPQDGSQVGDYDSAPWFNEQDTWTHGMNWQ